MRESMEFLDEDARPRFLFQSGAPPPPPSPTDSQPYNKPTKPLLILTLSLSTLLFALSLFSLQSEPFKSLLLWLSLSLLIGPFAPPSLTAGDIRVGQGPILHFPDQPPAADTDDDAAKKKKRSKPRRSDEIPVAAVVVAPEREVEKIRVNGNGNGNGVVLEEKEWSEEDVEVLKKQMAKHPVGKPGRWEAISAAFGGRHGAESVIKKAKELAEKKVDDSESYAQFLKKRKPVDKRVVEEEVESNAGENKVGGGESAWSSGEDIALLNALKAFPKDVAMRWDKVAAAVPAKSKAACMKRVAELKKGFRSAKAAAGDRVE